MLETEKEYYNRRRKLDTLKKDFIKRYERIYTDCYGCIDFDKEYFKAYLKEIELEVIHKHSGRRAKVLNS